MAGVDGAGERDVEHAKALVLHLVLGQFARGGVEARLAAGMAFGRQQVRRALSVAPGVSPHQRQEHDGEFQSLGAVQGHQLHAARVGLDAQLALLAVGRLAVLVQALFGQPGQQRVRAQARLGLLLQQFAQVAQVGEVALAAGVGQQARRRGFGQGQHHRQHAFAAPERAQLLQSLADGVAGILARGQRGHLRQRAAPQPREHGGAQHAFVLGAGQGLQQHLQLEGPVAVEHAGARAADAGHVQAQQLGAQGDDVVVGGQQNGDVAGRQALADDVTAALAVDGLRRVGQQRGDLRGAGLERGALALGLRDGRIAPQVQGQRRRHGLARDEIRRLCLPVAGLDRFVTDGLVAARIQWLAGRGVQPVHRLDQGRRGTMVGVERQPVPRVLARAQVGVHVAAAEAVDGLLGVADHHEPAARLAGGVAVEAVEDAVLLVVGVLELVHERHRPVGEQRIGQRRPCGHGGVGLADHFVEGGLTARGQALVAPGGDAGELFDPEALLGDRKASHQSRCHDPQRGNDGQGFEIRETLGANLSVKRELMDRREVLVALLPLLANQTIGQASEGRSQL